ncbi:MAG: cob(I)yrinic acid a,c-diamide adenosyltransferase [Thermosulfidibacteraceae bacterium]|jgi:cob(I)alamin adenosyltransferase
MSKFDRGYVQIYTGNGKGKTTCALGLMVRAVGAGLRVFIAQFLKGQEYSELKTIRERFSDLVDIRQYGTTYFVFKGRETEELKRIVNQGWEEVKEIIFSEKYNLVILDEVNVALYMGLLNLEDVLEVIRNKPEKVELILTGRYAPEELIEVADLVTEMREVKHYYTMGVQARVGIEK